MYHGDVRGSRSGHRDARCHGDEDHRRQHAGFDRERDDRCDAEDGPRHQRHDDQSPGDGVQDRQRQRLVRRNDRHGPRRDEHRSQRADGDEAACAEHQRAAVLREDLLTKFPAGNGAGNLGAGNRPQYRTPKVRTHI